MNASMNQKMHHQHSNPMFNMDVHSFMEKENQLSHVEISPEFGMTSRDVKVLKHRLSRN